MCHKVWEKRAQLSLLKGSLEHSFLTKPITSSIPVFLHLSIHPSFSFCGSSNFLLFTSFMRLSFFDHMLILYCCLLMCRTVVCSCIDVCSYVYPTLLLSVHVNGKIVNGLHLYSAFIQSAVQLMLLIHPFTHTAIGCHARYQPARQEQLGVRCLAQGHAQGGIEPATLRLSDDCSYLLSHECFTNILCALQIVYTLHAMAVWSLRRIHITRRWSRWSCSARPVLQGISVSSSACKMHVPLDLDPVIDSASLKDFPLFYCQNLFWTVWFGSLSCYMMKCHLISLRAFGFIWEDKIFL